MDEQRTAAARPGGAERPQESGAVSPGRGGRMSHQRKTAAVMRLLRGRISRPYPAISVSRRRR
jgi:hypothetical protein